MAVFFMLKTSLLAAAGTKFFVLLECAATSGTEFSTAGRLCRCRCGYRPIYCIFFVMAQGFVAGGAIYKAVCIPRSEIQTFIRVGQFCIALFAGLDIGQTAVPGCTLISHCSFSFQIYTFKIYSALITWAPWNSICKGIIFQFALVT